eukprot:scaffold280103_cov17-Tisochrysis_lutea.AAC.1
MDELRSAGTCLASGRAWACLLGLKVCICELAWPQDLHGHACCASKCAFAYLLGRMCTLVWPRLRMCLASAFTHMFFWPQDVIQEVLATQASYLAVVGSVGSNDGRYTSGTSAGVGRSGSSGSDGESWDGRNVSGSGDEDESVVDAAGS